MVGTATESCRRLIGLDLEDTVVDRLLEIARLHCKLVLEHGRAGTSPERRREIVAEIQSLRATRDALLRLRARD